MVATISPISAITDFDAPPIAEEEKEQEDTQQIWIYAIVIVGIVIAARIVFQIIKKRKQQSDDEFSTYNRMYQLVYQNNLHTNHLVWSYLLAF